MVRSRHHAFVARELDAEGAEVHLVLDVDIRITSLKSREGMTEPNYDFVVSCSSGAK